MIVTAVVRGAVVNMMGIGVLTMAVMMFLVAGDERGRACLAAE